VKRRWLTGLFVLAVAFGCSQSPAPSAPKPIAAKPVAAITPSPTGSDAPLKVSPPTAAPELDSSKADDAKAVSPSDEKKEPTKENEDGRDRSAERIAILTPGGPLLLDAHLTLDGHAYNEGVEAQLKEVLEAADANGDGHATWKELVDNESYLKGKTPDGMPPTARQKRMWTEQYDVDKNGHVERAEAAAWLGRDAGGAAKAFALRSSRSYAPDPRATSRLWALFDADSSGVLSLDEMRALPEMLLRLDEDDDQVITQPELVPLAEQLAEANAQRMENGRNDNHYAAIHLEPKEDVARVEYLLNDLYAARQDLTPASFPAFMRLGKALDEDGDDWLPRRELSKLLTTEPYVDLSVAFTAASGSEKAAGKIHLESHAPEVSVVSDAATNRIVLNVGGMRLIVSAVDLAPQAGSPPMQAPDRNQVRVMVHDKVDALFEELDENVDGRLGAREIASGADRLLARDADRDNQLTPDELPYVMVAAFMRSESPREQSFYVPATPPAAAMDSTAPAWFRHADFNGDGDISRREFLGSAEQFKRLDADRDGFMEVDEAASAR
jgi:Ca2+-binding EF-hand superfamily protein